MTFQNRVVVCNRFISEDGVLFYVSSMAYELMKCHEFEESSNF